MISLIAMNFEGEYDIGSPYGIPFHYTQEVLLGVYSSRQSKHERIL